MASHGVPPTPLQHALAGALAGVVAATACAPLDVARTRLQVQALILPPHLHAGGPLDMLRRIHATEGARGFYRGLLATTLGVSAQWLVFMPLYSMCRRVLGSAMQPRLQQSRVSRAGADALVQASAAAVTALIADTVTAPLWVVRTRLQVQGLHAHAQAAAVAAAAAASLPRPLAPLRSHYRGVAHALVTIVREEGFAALYKGLLASWLGISHVILYFPIYEATKAALARRRARREGASPTSTAARGREAQKEVFADSTSSSPMTVTTLEALLSSTLAKLIASGGTYPHEVVRSRLQDQFSALRAENRGPQHSSTPSAPTPTYTGPIDCARRIWRAEGIRGLYSGFSANLLRTLPATAITFVVFEGALREVEVWGHLLPEGI